MTSDKQQIFTKADFLTNAKVAKKLNVSTDAATKAMKTLYLKRATLRIQMEQGSRQTLAVIPNVCSHARNAYFLHPLAIDLIKQELKKQEGK